MSNNYPTRLDLCDGKYTVIFDLKTGQAECLRYGEPWRSLVGDKMVLAMFDELVAARDQRDRLLAAARIAADQIRCCDYTPARSTLLQAVALIPEYYEEQSKEIADLHAELDALKKQEQIGVEAEIAHRREIQRFMEKVK